MHQATVLSHNVCWNVCSPKGEMLSFFFFCVFCVWSGVFCRFLQFFSSKGRFFGKIFGSELLFFCFGVGFVSFGGFWPMFLLHFWRFAPESVWKILLMSGLLFFGFFLSSFGFFVDVVFRVFF